MKIRVTVTPLSRRERIVMGKQGMLEIAVREPAEHGAANERVRQLVALHFRVGIPAVRLVAGAHSARKTYSVTMPGA